MPQKSLYFFHIFLGIIVFTLGVFGVLAESGVSVPLFSSFFLEVILLFVGIFFIREAVRNKNSQQRFVHFLVGLSLFFFAIFPILVDFGILQFLPYYIQLDISPYVLSLLILCSAIYMIFDRIFLVVSQ